MRSSSSLMNYLSSTLTANTSPKHMDALYSPQQERCSDDSGAGMSEIGRPTIYTDELAKKICARIASGESIRSICQDEEMPSKATVMLWLVDGEHVYFSDQYAKARQIQAETLADELFDIADDGSNDWMERFSQDGEVAGYILNGEAVARSRLRVDTRKWYLSKVLPKFADKQEKQVTDNDRLFDALSNLIDKLPN